MGGNGTLRALIIGAVLFLSVSARASYSVVLALSMQSGTMAPGETSLGRTREVLDQGNTYFCGLYAAAAFLELWGNSQLPGSAPRPVLSAAFLGIGYNRLVGSGSNGVSTPWLLASIRRYGIIPRGSARASDGSFLPADWVKLHDGLIPGDRADELLTARYTSESESSAFTGTSYYDARIGLDVSQLNFYYAPAQETFRKAPDDDEVYPYRISDAVQRAASMRAELQRLGMATWWTETSADRLYRLVKAQLYAGRPVMVSIRAGIPAGGLRRHAVVGNSDLKEPGTATVGAHAVVAVGHCDKWDTRDDLCRVFAPAMKDKNVDECLVLQNSWGEDVNARGYFCVSRLASRRVLSQAAIQSGVAERVPRN